MPETPSQRRRTMQAVKSENTTPELVVRRSAHRLGYRYRLHQRDLPGTPDLVFSGRRKIIFVNGCFWHGHGCARGARTPINNREYWEQKIERNKARDRRAVAALRRGGWGVLVIWECELRDALGLARRLGRFLGP